MLRRTFPIAIALIRGLVEAIARKLGMLASAINLVLLYLLVNFRQERFPDDI